MSLHEEHVLHICNETFQVWGFSQSSWRHRAAVLFPPFWTDEDSTYTIHYPSRHAMEQVNSWDFVAVAVSSFWQQDRGQLLSLPVASRQAELAGIVPPVKGNCFVFVLNPLDVQGENHKKITQMKEENFFLNHVNSVSDFQIHLLTRQAKETMQNCVSNTFFSPPSWSVLYKYFQFIMQIETFFY